MEGCEAVSLGLGLGLGTSFVSKTIAEFVNRISSIGNLQKRLMKLDEYVTSLEDEMRKIEGFKRELPLCMFLLSDAIVYLKEQSKRWCGGSCKRPRPELREMSLLEKKRKCDDDEEEEVVDSEAGDDDEKKKKWMSSFQLCNTDLNLSSGSSDMKQIVGVGVEAEPRPVVVKHDVVEMPKSKMSGDLFQTFESGRYKGEGSGLLPFPVKSSCSPFSVMGAAIREERRAQPVMPVVPPVPELSLVTPVTSTFIQRSGSSSVGVVGGVPSNTPSVQVSSRSVMQMPPSVQVSSRSVMQMPHHQCSRKQRRCWSPELHRAFVDALQQLGGPQVATPKQIRDLMQVDGLTNDEVKSHLQKYRLHIRRVPNKQNDASASQTTVVLPGTWNPQDDHSGKSDKHDNDSESGSPTGPLDLDNMEADDDDDDEQCSSYD